MEKVFLTFRCIVEDSELEHDILYFTHRLENGDWNILWLDDKTLQKTTMSDETVTYAFKQGLWELLC